MSAIELIRLALGSLAVNRLRSILTMLGIIIGVGAVIALVSFGEGFQKSISDSFLSVGSNLMVVFAIRPSGQNAKLIKPKPLTQADAAAIANPLLVSGVAAVAPIFSVQANLSANGNSVNLIVNGSTSAWSAVRQWGVQEGEFIQESDVATSARVAVIGSDTAKKLFDDGSDPVGQDIRINNVSFQVIGVLETKGGFGNQDQTAVVPISTAQTRLSPNSARASNGELQVSSIFLTTISDKNITGVKSSIEQVLTDRHKVQFAGEEDFEVITLDQVLSVVNSITGLLTAFLALIAGISLFVGGIGVMNIMLVSVTERTKEIGLRKAVGAQYRDLMLQFLFESVVLSLGGGLLGVLMGALAAFVGGKLIPTLSLAVTPGAILLATGVSTIIGVFFGLYPASRAASMSPIQALRHE